MYISTVIIRNFRVFGAEPTIIKFKKGLNVIVGENDCGKSAILDAIRIVLGTTDQSWYRITESDFHNEDISSEINITCTFIDLNEKEKASFLECLTYESNENGTTVKLVLNWSCKSLKELLPLRITTSITTGINGDGPSPAPEARELLRATYLKALRDSSSDMQAGRSSRLSHIIQGLPSVTDGISKYVSGMDLEKLSLAGIADLSNQLLKEHKIISDVNTSVTDILQKGMMLNGDNLKTKIEVAGSNITEMKKVTALLEKLDLTIDNSDNTKYGYIGLGTSNLVSMACELLLNKNNQGLGFSSFLLIEEPEAHIHAQRQLRLIQSFQTEQNISQQVILTTHSPLLASVVKLENLILIKNKNAYSMDSESTKLAADDYKYLERYLDATKANLFFARGVMIVEGPAEELLLPTIAKLLGYDFAEYGISLVNARGTGLSRFSKIFQRNATEEKIGINVSCIADRDIMPDCAPGICIDISYVDEKEWPEQKKRKWKCESEVENKDTYLSDICNRANGQTVKTFVSDHWTFEYDLAYSGLLDDMIDVIVTMSYVETNREKNKKEIKEKISKYELTEEKSSYVYRAFYKKNISKAEFAQEFSFYLEEKYNGNTEEFKKKLPKYIVDAIEYVVQ